MHIGDNVLKKVYIEITNVCNLKCDFCIQNKRHKMFMSEEDFMKILHKLKGYTKYLYFHILGEPLLHPKISTLIKMAYENGFFVNITTNGYLISKIHNISNLRQLNISLHSYDEKYHISLDDYLQSIFKVVDLLPTTYISYRLWVKNKYTQKILDILNEHYHTSIKMSDIEKNVTLSPTVFINSFHEFIWPDLENGYYKEEGNCYALRDHVGILVDGTIVPCCLDSRGTIALGNIFVDSLDSVFQSSRVHKMIDAFRRKERCEEFCRHCSFIDT